MSYLEALLLGLLQGLTEFLPISSSGHLVLLEHLLRAPESARMAVTAVLHLGTALALVAYFRRELAEIIGGAFSRRIETRSASLKTAGYIALASVPAAVVGLIAADRIDAAFSQPAVVGPMLIVTGVALFTTRFARERGQPVDSVVALAVGAVQAVAIIPGISRSGATIAMALFLGLKRTQAFEFSFVMSVPVILAAAVKELLDVDWHTVPPAAMALGVLAAFGAGLAALVLLRRAVAGRRFFWFAFYCWAAGLAALVFVR
ncbi:MAG: undecaprenyl-diphosphate phosphatase [candidate division WOR-3 bacterium]